MSDVTQILSAIEQRDPQSSAQFLPLVYEELRRLAARKLTQEAPNQTLQATALVHEVYLRLVHHNQVHHWDNRGYFFAAAAEAMCRILIEGARAKGGHKRQGTRLRFDVDACAVAIQESPDQLLALDDALIKRQAEDPAVFELVKLRYSAGLSVEQAAAAAAELESFLMQIDLNTGKKRNVLQQ